MLQRLNEHQFPNPGSATPQWSRWSTESLGVSWKDSGKGVSFGRLKNVESDVNGGSRAQCPPERRGLTVSQCHLLPASFTTLSPSAAHCQGSYFPTGNLFWKHFHRQTHGNISPRLTQPASLPPSVYMCRCVCTGPLVCGSVSIHSHACTCV